MTQAHTSQLISHTATLLSVTEVTEQIKQRIHQQGDKPHVSVQKQLAMLTELSQFDFGRFLLQNSGINGFWTHYMLTHPWYGRKTKTNNRGEAFSPMENFILDHAPLMLATQERFEIFLRESQTAVKNGATLACIPCGMMGELLYLDYTHIDSIRLIGMDYDFETIQAAQTLADSKQLSRFTNLLIEDAWNLEISNEFDLISCNGLTIYEPNHEKVTDLYHRFQRALKPGGKLVTSFFTYPPTLTDACEWDITQINAENLLQQRIVFIDILAAKFQCYRSSQQTREQLQDAGFDKIELIYDAARLFPTVVAYKPL